MSQWPYYLDMDNASAQTVVAEIGKDIAGYGGRMDAFAFSPDAIDKFGPEATRRRATELAKAIATWSDAEVEVVAASLDAACTADPYATKEIAGRFRSAVKRVRLVAKVERHPRAAHFRSLVDAVSRGRFTQPQWDLAVKLASEVA